MPRVSINIETDNDAFATEDHGSHEIAKILRGLAAKFEENNVPSRILDTNGNTTGTVVWIW